MDVEMKVGGLETDRAERMIKHAVTSMEGVQHIEVHASAGVVKIDYNQEEITLKEILNVIEAQGFIVDK